MRSYSINPVPQFEPQKLYLESTVKPYDLFPKTSEKFTKTKMRGRDANLMTLLKENYTKSLIKQHTEVERAVKQYEELEYAPTRIINNEIEVPDLINSTPRGSSDDQSSESSFDNDMEMYEEPVYGVAPQGRGFSPYKTQTQGTSAQTDGDYEDYEMKNFKLSYENLKLKDENQGKQELQQILKQLQQVRENEVGQLNNQISEMNGANENLYMEKEYYRKEVQTILHQILLFLGFKSAEDVEVSITMVQNAIYDALSDKEFIANTPEILKLKQRLNNVILREVDHKGTQTRNIPPAIVTNFSQASSSGRPSSSLVGRPSTGRQSSGRPSSAGRSQAMDIDSPIQSMNKRKRSPQDTIERRSKRVAANKSQKRTKEMLSAESKIDKDGKGGSPL